MKIRTKKKFRVTRKIVTEILCNLCGESCVERDTPGVTNGYPFAIRGASFKVHGGYGDTFPPDMESWQIDLCEPCLGLLVSKFKIYPFAYNQSFTPPDYIDKDGRGPYRAIHDLLTEGKTEGVDGWNLSVWRESKDRQSRLVANPHALGPTHVDCGECHGSGKVLATCSNCKNPLTVEEFERGDECHNCTEDEIK